MAATPARSEKPDASATSVLASSGSGGSAYRRACNVTGARVLHTLLRAGQLHALFLTSAHRLIAGEPFTSPVQGPALPRPADLRLVSLYYDASALDGAGQTFARYDRVAPRR